MTTYNSYQEAKISNPDSVIYKASGNFYTLEGRFTVVTSEPLIMCSPADYCMTVEKFLADGHKFELGDICLDGEGYVINIDVEGHTWNKPDKFDVDRYVLQAAALKEKPKPTKFVKVEESIFDLKEEFERGELFTKKAWGEYVLIKEDTHLALLYEMQSHENSKIGIYRQIEIDWRDELAEFTGLGKDFYTWVDCIDDMYDFNFVEMCHLVASLTEKPTN